MQEEGIQYVPAALRRFVYHISAHALRMRINANTHMVFVRGKLAGVIVEGKVSCCYLGRLYDSIEAVDFAVASGGAR